MANTTNTKHTCDECVFFEAIGFCKKANFQARAKNYACPRFRTPEEHAEDVRQMLLERQKKAEEEQKKIQELKRELAKKEEQRLNFLLTGLYIQSTATLQMLEYFDMQWVDKKTESDWRFRRKQAANKIDRCIKEIRDLYQHNFMEDQTEVMTDHGRKDFDVESYDNHEDDARQWCRLLLHHMETSWQDDEKEAQIFAYYENLPRVGIFHPKDFKHFITKR